jgi:hypothetical protein
MRRTLTLALACASCAYNAGDYRDWNQPDVLWLGAHVELACLDVAIVPVHDEVAPDPVLALHFGNRCDHRVAIDLAAVRVVAGDHRLAPHDPAHELVPRDLPARWIGGETIGYEQAGSSSRVCVDVGALERGSYRADATRCFEGPP